MFQCEGESFSAPKLSIDEWGPRLWGAVEVYAQLYPDTPTRENKAFAQKLFEKNGVLHTLVPCPSCRAHYNEYAAQFPPDVSGKEA